MCTGELVGISTRNPSAEGKKSWKYSCKLIWGELIRKTEISMYCTWPFIRIWKKFHSKVVISQYQIEKYDILRQTEQLYAKLSFYQKVSLDSWSYFNHILPPPNPTSTNHQSTGGHHRDTQFKHCQTCDKRKSIHFVETKQRKKKCIFISILLAQFP